MNTTIAAGFQMKVPSFQGDNHMFQHEVFKKFGEHNPDVMRAISPPHFCNTIHQPVTVRLTTPLQLGYPDGIKYHDGVHYNIAQRNNLTNCDDATPVRIALLFEQVRTKLPEEYMRKSGWWIHMFPIPNVHAGDKFISGRGMPKPIFVIKPAAPEHEILEVQWIYDNIRDPAYRNQPMLFQYP